MPFLTSAPPRRGFVLTLVGPRRALGRRLSVRDYSVGRHSGPQAKIMLRRAGLALVRLDAQKVGDGEPYESANQRYNAENQHRPSRSSAVKFDTESSKMEGRDQHPDEVNDSDQRPIDMHVKTLLERQSERDDPY